MLEEGSKYNFLGLKISTAFEFLSSVFKCVPFGGKAVKSPRRVFKCVPFGGKERLSNISEVNSSVCPLGEKKGCQISQQCIQVCAFWGKGCQISQQCV